MLDELTQELLDLTATETGCVRAAYASRISLCCCCSCCDCIYGC